VSGCGAIVPLRTACGSLAVSLRMGCDTLASTMPMWQMSNDYGHGGSFMKLAHINPTESGQWFKAGRTRKVGKWTFADSEDETTFSRIIAHHGHVMGEFTIRKADVATGFHGDVRWGFTPISTGWGSASDQQGMNKIMPSAWKFRRNGGHARYEYNGVEVKC
jgi:hypothetical protein